MPNWRPNCRARGRELLRQLFQDSMDLRAHRERPRAEVVGADAVVRTRVESGHTRALTTVFGEVSVSRMAYRAPGRANLHPADAELNLPAEKHSHGLRRLAAIEAARGSFDDTVAAIDRYTGVGLGKRQVERLAVAAAADFDDFYAQRTPPTPDPGEDPKHKTVLVCSVDGKGIVMRPDALRPATAKAADTATTKLRTRLSKGEKRNRKRLAEIGAVYHAAPVPRTAADILADSGQPHRSAPVAVDKWLTASVIDDAATVISAVFDEADRRDPNHQITRIALVDGNNHQINRIHTEAAARGIDITIIVDFIHVLEYLWKTAWCFHDEADPAAETWVRDKATAILDGDARASRRRHPPPCHPTPARQTPTRGRRRLRRLPHRQGPLPGLSPSAAIWLADRYRRHRRRLPPPRQGPPRHHRSPLGTHRRRSHPQAPRPAQQRRLRHLLAIPPRPRTQPSPPNSLPRRPNPKGRMTSLQKSRTHRRSSIIE